MVDRAGYLIQPFAIVRPPFSLLNSAIQEQIKNGIYWPVVGLGDLIAPYTTNGLVIRNDISRIKNLRQVFGSTLKLIPYRVACNGHAGLPRFLLEKILGINQSALLDHFNSVQRNKSRGNLWIRLQNQINRAQPAILNNQHNPLHYQLKDLPESSYKHDSPFRLTTTEFNLVKDQFEQIKEQLAKLLSDEFLNETREFSDPLEAKGLLEVLLQELRRPIN